ncbi:neutral zinc metallopeptidase [Spongiactinospora sp. TRM90649]|uniref:neutral zinc metallopeptidase n=1 Tax=Spongiactinospora sp. TRM90649 TaxID=3031114 RepID=UPI0023F7E8CE|nr:neutral zinc metallopeptidase [Spongiactinospora sp. TRM90649]MDF5756085.1 neutral zinc metallopeptidase [Spongiactinospora sp. TRM90649]
MPDYRTPPHGRNRTAWRLLALTVGTAITVAACPSPILGGDDPPADKAGGQVRGQARGAWQRPTPLPSAGPVCEKTAKRPEDCRIARIVASIESYWKGYFERRGEKYRPAKTVFFDTRTRTPCGPATPAVGPFYCPTNEVIYLYRTFFDTLEREHPTTGGPLAQAYVIAHEFGHHAQDLLGQLPDGGREDSQREELQADCYSGVWGKYAVGTRFFPRPFSDPEIRQMFDTAEKVGQATIDMGPNGSDSEWVGPGQRTFDQRRKWFTIGYQTGDPARCDTSRDTSEDTPEDQSGE